ncbi:hypothetical protein BDW71DRAFT_186912 [Aspergillus fruticulosus]
MWLASEGSMCLVGFGGISGRVTDYLVVKVTGFFRVYHGDWPIYPLDLGRWLRLMLLRSGVVERFSRVYYLQ